MSNSYTQALHTGVDNLLDTPKRTREVAKHLTYGCTLDAYNTRSLLHLNDKKDHSFNYLVKVKKMINKKRQSLLLVGSLLALQGASTAQAATPNADSLRLYAHSRLVDFKQFVCFNKIITKESNWRVNAVNGSHYGIGQMRSKHYRNLDGYRQVDATIKYIAKRYGTPCGAWVWHVKHNWY